jgi:hypothetical protein
MPCNVCFAEEVKETINQALELPSNYFADSMEPSLREVTDKAGKIFAGKCISVEEIKYDPIYSLRLLQYTFIVSNGIKDEWDNQEVTFKQWQPKGKSFGFKQGGKYLLFLYPMTSKNFTRPVDLIQGQYKIKNKGFIKKYEIVVSNEPNSKKTRNELKGKKYFCLNDDYKSLNYYINECSRNKLPIRYKNFVQFIKNVTKVEKKCTKECNN